MSQGIRKERVGVVVTKNGEKTIVIKIDRITKHSNYKRVMKKTKKIMVHDAEGKAKIGDKVRIQETRPLTKNKRWRLLEILK